ncbi:DUF3592 domain-containing protein [Shinella zoogloeoides]|uniref:DUF3592 domain-containing protein n=1 Tax=Shinella zoogloeoides TaxID=352475 RepID=UPI00136A175E|nr:DUF3592 domain-containing protein [Shinella zoogloeoides]UEX81671.1 DUF3592 domain-containing protein [Shinella zoogloeoides]
MELKLILIGFGWAASGLFAFATFLKWKEVRAAERWLPVQGKVVSSRVEAREVRVPVSGANRTDTKELRNFPAIIFAYTVDGRVFQGTRHSLRHQVGNFQVAETLARYPRGAEVTVYYDPSNPKASVIERTLPDGAIKVMAWISAGLLIGSIALVFLVGGVLEAIRSHLPSPQNAGAAMLLTIMALIMVRMAFVLNAAAQAAVKWPTAQGSITSSEIEAFRIHSFFEGFWRRPWRILFKSRVRYAYTVAGQEYASDRIAFGATVAASLTALIGGDARRYPEGGRVTVHHDPANPALAVLECRVRGLWILWGGASAMLIGAAMLAGLLAR